MWIYLYLIALVAGVVWLTWRTFTGRAIGRKLVFLFIGVALSGAVLAKIVLPVKETAPVRAVYDTIDNLAPGSVILMSLDYDPAAIPELEPMATAVTRHCFARGVKICFMTLWGTGGAMITNITRDVIEKEFPEKVYGVDYCNVGYKAGNEAVLRVIATDFQKTFPMDANATPLDSLPIMKSINSCADFAYIFGIGVGRPGVKEWVEYVADPVGVKLGGGSNAVSAPQLYAYYPGQINGILGGSKGAAEYEIMLKNGYPQFEDSKKYRRRGVEIMGPQAVAHVLIMVFIVLGNVSYFRARKKERPGA